MTCTGRTIWNRSGRVYSCFYCSARYNSNDAQYNREILLEVSRNISLHFLHVQTMLSIMFWNMYVCMASKEESPLALWTWIKVGENRRERAGKGGKGYMSNDSFPWSCVVIINDEKRHSLAVVDRLCIIGPSVKHGHLVSG